MDEVGTTRMQKAANANNKFVRFMLQYLHRKALCHNSGSRAFTDYPSSRTIEEIDTERTRTDFAGICLKTILTILFSIKWPFFVLYASKVAIFLFKRNAAQIYRTAQSCGTDYRKNAQPRYGKACGARLSTLGSGWSKLHRICCIGY